MNKQIGTESIILTSIDFFTLTLNAARARTESAGIKVNFTGIEEDVLKHEETCSKNYNRKSCLTCKHCSSDGIKKTECKQGKEIPEGRMFEKCPLHEKGTPEITGFMQVFSEAFKI